MRLLIDETFATATYTRADRLRMGLASGWDHGRDRESNYNGFRIEESIVLAPASEILRLQQTHAMAAGVAVIADANGAIAMRTPVRPDEVEATPVRLLDTSGLAELLASDAEPFYGIEPTSWVRDGDSPEAAPPRSSSSREPRRCASRRPASARI